MRFVGKSAPLPFVLLPYIVLAPVAALAAQTRSSMEVTVQVVPGYSSAAAAAVNAQIGRIGAAGVRGTTSAVAGSNAECKAIGNRAIVDGVWATCSWEPDTSMYLVTIQY
ncbi:MAG TPA: hypothetical protein VN735_12695 [Steroidobacteraceae bacterium]|nr:hypothetical protein [Steroidobacteraceae bacterium]